MTAAIRDGAKAEGYVAVGFLSDVISKIGDGLWNAFLMAWEVWWALVLGFFISAVVQAWVPREHVEAALSGKGFRPVARATGLGAASSSCSYAAIAIAKSLFQKGASAASALAFQFASTNLVWELGLVLWVLLGWQFTLAEYLGGIVMIALMSAMLRLFVSPRLEQGAREHAREADSGHQHHTAGKQMSWPQRLTSASAWSDVAHNFRGDWQMLWKEITAGFLLAATSPCSATTSSMPSSSRTHLPLCRPFGEPSSVPSSPSSASSARSATSRSPPSFGQAGSASPA